MENKMCFHPVLKVLLNGMYSRRLICQIRSPQITTRAFIFAVNEKTTKVIEAAFQHARYPSTKGEKSLLFIGKVTYGLDKWVDARMHAHYKHICDTRGVKACPSFTVQFGDSQPVDWSERVWAASRRRHRHGDKQCVCSVQGHHPVWIRQLAVSMCDRQWHFVHTHTTI